MAETTCRSVHTDTFSALLADLGVSLAVTTYQAGKLVLVRSDGAEVNTRYQDFLHPTGLALAPGRLSVGTRCGVWTYTNQPELAARLDPAGRHDAVYLPRHFHVTGDIAVHELVYAGDDLVAVNTRFSCLATFDGVHSFIPRWNPPFITELLPEDRCHLNGLCAEGTDVRYCTAHGISNTHTGWRPGKVGGGAVLEVPTGRVVRDGLSMPHSPRLHGGRLWVCDSGNGALVAVDPTTGHSVRTGMFPGFTRGLDFAGPVAFVGLSQIRQHSEFGGLPFTQRVPVEDRKCGVWAVDTRDGNILGFLEFTAGVREVFAVTVLPHRWPELLTDPAADPCLWSYLLPPADGIL